MKNKLNSAIVAALAGISLFAIAPMLATTASAQTLLGAGVSASATTGITAAGITASGSTGVKLTAREQNIVTHANQEIDRRITALNALSTRVNTMVNLSVSEKSSLSSTIQTQITAMTTLQAQIATDQNNLTTLKTDVQSITKTYRIFALVIPQGAIEAAADRIMTIDNDMTTLSGKLQARISALPSGTDTTSLNASLADMNTQIANASTSASAAVAEVANLQPDNGNATTMASNTAALKDARSKIQAAQKDLTAARKDAGTIVKALEALNGTSAAASATVTGSGTTP